MSYPIANLDGISPEIVKLLKSVRIRTTSRMLDAACSLSGRKRLAAQTGLSERQFLHWANMADRMRIRGIGEENAKLLEAAGVVTIRDLKFRNPSKLAKALAAANAKRKLVRNLPNEKAVERWVKSAAKLELKITY